MALSQLSRSFPRLQAVLLLVALGGLGSCASSPGSAHDSGNARSDDYLWNMGGYDNFGGGLGPSTRTLHSMARVLAGRGRDAQCELVLNRLIEEHPGFMPAYNELAELHLRREMPDQAIGALEAGLALDAEDAVLLNNLGMCHLLQGRYAEALEWFTRAASAAPQDASCQTNIAVALANLGHLDQALAYYLRVVPAKDAHYNLGVLSEAMGDYDRAAEEFELAGASGRRRPNGNREPTRTPSVD